MNIEMACPACLTDYSYAPKYINRQVECAYCGHSFVVQDPAQPMPQPAPLAELQAELSKQNVEVVNPAREGPTLHLHQHATRKVQTIEKTAKTWKLCQLIGVLLICAGFLVALLSDNPQKYSIIFIIGTLGLMFYFIGKLGAWWYHG